ncbi:hypothetical protein CC80DRAFT_548901 [Byssothecium circinans]|uniref:Uncharacterized protein n=1 Tax=Byssothecium circinans TaxID=147558 RepID=A0A6A5TSB4_9PLEO|nr:hypothetical protein CC80DRAFT_548901 [Byssothecium circinans]
MVPSTLAVPQDSDGLPRSRSDPLPRATPATLEVPQHRHRTRSVELGRPTEMADGTFSLTHGGLRIITPLDIKLQEMEEIAAKETKCERLVRYWKSFKDSLSFSRRRNPGRANLRALNILGKSAATANSEAPETLDIPFVVESSRSKYPG